MKPVRRLPHDGASPTPRPQACAAEQAKLLQKQRKVLRIERKACSQLLARHSAQAERAYGARCWGAMQARRALLRSWVVVLKGLPKLE